jgi:hypothetical protein
LLDIFYFIEDPNAPSSVVDWFRKLEMTPEEVPTEDGLVLFFRELGALKITPEGCADPKCSPVVTVRLPLVRRGVLWSVGELRFLPLRTAFPALNQVRRSFESWIREHDTVFDVHPASEHRFDYYLEGGSRNRGPIHALPTGLEAIRAGRYFVAARESEASLDRVCRTLRLRGIDCAP